MTPWKFLNIYQRVHLLLRKRTLTWDFKRWGTIIIDLKFWSDNLCENVHNISLEDKKRIENDEIIDLSETFEVEVQPTLDLSIKPNGTIKVVQQNQVKEAKMIEMILVFTLKDKKVWRRFIEKVKFIEEFVEH